MIDMSWSDPALSGSRAQRAERRGMIEPADSGERLIEAAEDDLAAQLLLLTEAIVDWRTVMRIATILATVTLSAVSAGCSMGTDGELGAGTFYYDCAGGDQSDSACYSGWSNYRPIPSDIAVGGTFRVTFEPNGSSSGSSTTVTGVSDETVQTKAWGMAFLEAGQHTLLALSYDDMVIDYTHVQASEVAQLLLTDSAPLTMTVGDTRYLRVDPVDEQGDTLAGRFDYQWTSSDGAVLAVHDATSMEPMIEALAAGSAVVQVSSESRFTTLSVTVQEAL